MQKNNLSPFYAEWIGVLKEDLEQRQRQEDFQPTPQLKALFEGTSPTSADQSLKLGEILENYQQLLNAKGPIYLEKVLMDSFPAKDFAELGLARYFPRMYRGLPRLYDPNSPSQSHIKKHFTSLSHLKRGIAAKALFSLYENLAVKGVVTIFTWVIDDGLGDYMAALELLEILRNSLPSIRLQLVLLIEKKMAAKLTVPQGALIIPYEEECPLSSIPQEALELLRGSDLILQMPTFYPKTKELLEVLAQIPSSHPIPKMELIGEYGFLESSWFHPKSGGYSMGLHFLEKGILIRPPRSATWSDVENKQIRQWHVPDNRFYLAYLTSVTGGAIYLHSLLKSLEKDTKDIDLCLPDLGWFIRFVENQQKAARPILEWDVGVRSIEVRFQDQLYVMAIAPEGKALRLLAPSLISQNDFEALLTLSGEPVAVRGNQSFSEAVSQGKAFFYDGRAHARYFFKDLVAIAENRIKSHPTTLACIRAMYQGFVHQLPLQTEGFVDETFFQPLEEWSEIALSIGVALQNPDTIVGFKKLNRIIAEELSANHFLCHLVKRALCHRQRPQMAQLEELEMQSFLSHSQSFAQMIQSHRANLARK